MKSYQLLFLFYLYYEINFEFFYRLLFFYLLSTVSLTKFYYLIKLFIRFLELLVYFNFAIFIILFVHNHL